MVGGVRTVEDGSGKENEYVQFETPKRDGCLPGKFLSKASDQTCHLFQKMI
jgi:hypothetical protein